MTIVDVVGIALMFAISVTVIVAIAVVARSEYRTNRELRERIERMKGDKRD